jgi:hypothetical protein
LTGAGIAPREKEYVSLHNTHGTIDKKKNGEVCEGRRSSTNKVAEGRKANVVSTYKAV